MDFFNSLLGRPSDEWGDSYTGVMTSSCSELAHIHDRWPVILTADQWEAWLTLPLPSLYQIDKPYPAERMAVEASTNLWAQRQAFDPLNWRFCNGLHSRSVN